MRSHTDKEQPLPSAAREQYVAQQAGPQEQLVDSPQKAQTMTYGPERAQQPWTRAPVSLSRAPRAHLEPNGSQARRAGDRRRLPRPMAQAVGAMSSRSRRGTQASRPHVSTRPFRILRAKFSSLRVAGTPRNTGRLPRPGVLDTLLWILLLILFGLGFSTLILWCTAVVLLAVRILGFAVRGGGQSACSRRGRVLRMVPRETDADGEQSNGFAPLVDSSG